MGKKNTDGRQANQLFTKLHRPKVGELESVVAAQFRLLRELAGMVEDLLPPGPSPTRIQLRDFKAHITTVFLGETLVARDTDVAWEQEDGEIPETDRG